MYFRYLLKAISYKTTYEEITVTFSNVLIKHTLFSVFDKKILKTMSINSLK